MSSFDRSGTGIFNAIIAGNGAIGSALAHCLLQREELGRLFVLSRNGDHSLEDHRVSGLAVDASSPDSIIAAAQRVGQEIDRVHLLFNTVGFLHTDKQMPEKHLKAVQLAHLQEAFMVNATFLPLLAQAFSGVMRHGDPAVLASLSARVGSIEDNRLGGWYSYRASKAAHNMLLKSIAREWRISHRNVTVAALHPGTVQSRLSRPFISERYSNRVLTPQECADSLLWVIDSLGPADSGSFLDWQGKTIPW